MLEIREKGKNWVAVPESAVLQLDDQGRVKQRGYGSRIKQGANTNVDGRAAFSGSNQIGEVYEVADTEFMKVKVTLGKTYAGKTVQFRWRFVTAETQAEVNDFWALDELEFSGVVGHVFAKTRKANSKSCQ